MTDFARVFISVCGLLTVFAQSRHTSNNEHQGGAGVICTSHSGLCHLSYNLTLGNTDHTMPNDRPICRCPGQQTCNMNWGDDTNSITTVLRNAGQEIQVKLSYCHLRRPDTVCREQETAIVLRGRGALHLDVAEGFRCRCYHDLYAHASWREGEIDYVAYSCWKDICRRHQNRHHVQPCERVTYNGSPDNLRHDYLCRCRQSEECVAHTLPTARNRVVMKTCEPHNRNGHHKR